MAKAAEAAYSVVRDAILSGEFARGERLREEMLAGLAGVSRTPIREALRRLDAEGLVEFRPNRGARVTAWSTNELEDLYDARALLESQAARLAASRISADELAELTDLCVRMTEATTRGASAVDKISELNGDFHRLVVTASRNSQLAVLIRGVVDAPLVYRTFQRYSPARLRASMFHHSELVGALRAGDGEWAGSMMRAHILAARWTVLESVRNEDGGSVA